MKVKDRVKQRNQKAPLRDSIGAFLRDPDETLTATEAIAKWECSREMACRVLMALWRKGVCAKLAMGRDVIYGQRKALEQLTDVLRIPSESIQEQSDDG